MTNNTVPTKRPEHDRKASTMQYRFDMECFQGRYQSGKNVYRGLHLGETKATV